MKQFTFFKTLLIAAVMLLGSGSVIGQKTYEMITSNAGLVDGGKYLIMGQKGSVWYALGKQNNNNRAAVEVTVTGNKTTVTVATAANDDKPFEITLGTSGSNWTLFDAVNNGYLYAASSSSNHLKTQPSPAAGFTISIDANGVATIKDVTSGANRDWMRFNSTNNPPLFSCYGSGQDNIYLFKEVTGAPTITVTPATLSGFTYVSGNGPSAAQEFTVSGSNLTANISLTAPTNYEISTSAGSGYGGSLSLTQSGGSVASTTIYARLKAGLAVGNYNGETVNITSTGATAKTVTLSGSVTAPALDAPVATAATAVGSTGFTANWNAVSGATSYRLEVYTKTAGGTMTDLIISEYVEGSSSNKYIEIYNGTGASVNLSDYKLQLYANGASSTTNDVTLSGTLPSGETMVYKNSGANLTLPEGVTAVNNAAVNFNGDDAVVLYKISTGSYVDIFGVIGNDPGSAWTATGGYTTVDKTLRRKASVTGGVTTNPSGTGAGAFTTLATEWDMFDTDNVSGLGSHTANTQANTPITGSPFTVENGNYHDITGLTASTTYYYRVKAVAGEFESEESNEISVTTLVASPVATFSGTGNWHEASKWSTNSVPNSTTDVVIAGNVTVTENYAECKNMIINPGGALTVVNIDGVLKQLVINGDLLIKSDAGGTGSVIFNSSFESGNFYSNILILGTSNATIERYISAADWNNAGSGWHLISSPVSVELIEGKWTPTGNDNDYDFYALDESKENEYWLNQKVSENGIDFFEPGIGYLVAYQQSDTKEFNATDIVQEVKVVSINTSDITISGLANTTGSAYPGWHLLGNPFSSALKYEDWEQTNIDAEIQVWSSADGSYKTSTEVEGIIPAMNGFMVHTSGNGSITIPASKRVHNSTNWYKSGEDFILLVARDLDGTTSQSSIVRFNPAATAGYDSQFDSYFLAGFAPMFYSVSGEDLYALNTLPEQSSGLVVPFGFVKNNSFNFSIGLEKSLPGLVLFLTDNKTGETVNLTEAGSYQFTSEEGDDANRFALHFAPLGIEKPGAALDAKIYAYQQVIYLAGLDTKTEVTITDLMGRTVKRVQLNGGGLSTINAAGLPKGAYIVTAVSASGSVSAKVIL